MTIRINGISREELQAMLDETAAATGVVGAQLSISLDGQGVDLACGLANIERNAAMTPDTIGQIGSITKLLNAALVLSLVEDAVLSLDRPIDGYASDLRLLGGAEHEITLRQLLSMSAGLDNGPYSVRDGGDDTLSAYVRSIADLPLPYQPGRGFGYSNAGTCLAGYVAQIVGGRPWASLLHARVLDPCGLTEWAMGADRLPFFRLSVGHLPAEPGSVPQVIRPWGYSAAQAPAGSTMAMSARDLARFGRALVDDGGAGLSEATVRAMTTPTATVPAPIPSIGIGDAWGLGPSRDRWGSREVWSHAGGMASARCLMSCIPSSRGVIAMTANTPARFLDFAARILERVGSAVFGIAPPTSRLPADPFRPRDLARFAGIYTRFGTRYDLDVRNGHLHYEETNLGIALPGEVLGRAVSSVCMPFAEDRFLITIPGFREPMPVAFDGTDEGGRATRLTSTLFPARRIGLADGSCP